MAGKRQIKSRGAAEPTEERADDFLTREVKDVIASSPAAIFAARRGGEILFANESARWAPGLLRGDDTVFKLDSDLHEILLNTESSGNREVVLKGVRYLLSVTVFETDGWEIIAQRRETNKSEGAKASGDISFLGAIIDAIPAVVNVKDKDGKFLLANPTFAEFYHSRPEDIVGSSLEDLPDPEYIAQTQHRDLSVLESGEPMHFFDESGTDLEGLPSYWITTKVPLFDDDGNAVHVLTVAVDVTERRKVEDALRAAKVAAEDAITAKNQFLANTSHELRTPLNAIMGFAKLIKRKTSSDLDRQSAENLDKILASATRLLELIDNLLTLSRVETDALASDRRPFDVRELVEVCLRWVAPQIDSGKIRLDRELPTTAIELKSDRKKVRQILCALLDNAAKFTREGRIIVTVEPADDSLLFNVTDSGIGIAESRQAEIFEAFRQLDSGTTKAYQGMGLGLTVSQQIAKALGGSLSLKSVAGEGSIFTLSLPWQEED